MTTRRQSVRLRPVVSYDVVRSFGADPTGSRHATQAIQNAIDEVHVLGGGEVYCPPGTYLLNATASSETFYNGDASALDDFPASNGCLILRSGVVLRGAGHATKFQTALAAKTAIYVLNGQGSGIRDLWLHGVSSTAGAAMGIFSVLDDDDTTLEYLDMSFSGLEIEHFGAYAVGLQNGIMRRVRMDRIRAYDIGADGIDIKNRDPLSDSTGIVLNDIYVDTFGRRLDGEVGIDVRGVCTLSNITIMGLGRSSVTQDGIRFRTMGDTALYPDFWGRRSSLTNFYVRGDNSLTTRGVYIGSSDVSVANGTVEGAERGVYLAGNSDGVPEYCSIVGVKARDCTVYGFEASSSVNHNTFAACHAIDCATGFRDAGTYTKFVGCGTPGCTTPLSTSVGASATQIRVGNEFSADFATFAASATGRAGLATKGTSTDIDLELNPKGTGVLRFGTHTALGSETLSGYITIKDSAGNSRKIAVVS